IAIFLLSTGISKEVYVATAVLYFAILNYLKVIPYVLTGILNLDALISGLALLPFVPLGTYAGFFLNRRIPSRHFTTFIYSLLVVTGCYFLAGADIACLLAGLPPKP
ncbi:MAG: hypothetical protein QW390_04605, partial [Candidatus Bathyarchaeia archaeon]